MLDFQSKQIRVWTNTGNVNDNNIEDYIDFSILY